MAITTLDHVVAGLAAGSTLAHITCRITTNSSPIQRVDERTLIVTIQDR